MLKNIGDKLLPPSRPVNITIPPLNFSLLYEYAFFHNTNTFLINYHLFHCCSYLFSVITMYCQPFINPQKSCGSLYSVIYLFLSFVSRRVYYLSITVVARSKAWNIFARSNTGIVGSNLTQDIDVCVNSVFVLGSGLATGWSPIQVVLPTM
jgi:hypothetical protein